MKAPLSHEHHTGSIAAITEHIQRDKALHSNWTEYLSQTLGDLDDVVSYGTLVMRLGDLRAALVKLTPTSQKGSLKLAMFDVKNVLSADSLREGYLFGMLVNDESFVQDGIVTRGALDRLAPYIDTIFDEIQATYSTPDDVVWTLQLYGENFYQRAIAHPGPIKPLIDSICDELYPIVNDHTDFTAQELRDIDILNFHHGFGIARQAYATYLLAGQRNA